MSSASWKYWDADDRGGMVTWINYPPSVSHTLSRALYSGKKGVTVNLGGKQYYVNFTDMTQRSSESHGERPVAASVRFRPQCTDAEILQSLVPVSCLFLQLKNLRRGRTNV